MNDEMDCGHDHSLEGDLAYLRSLGDLREWWERQHVERHEENERRLAENEARKAEHLAKWQPAVVEPAAVDPEVAELIRRAEAWLGAGAADV